MQKIQRGCVAVQVLAKTEAAQIWPVSHSLLTPDKKKPLHKALFLCVSLLFHINSQGGEKSIKFRRAGLNFCQL